MKQIDEESSRKGIRRIASEATRLRVVSDSYYSFRRICLLLFCCQFLVLIASPDR
jgi:hypothetical protein